MDLTTVVYCIGGLACVLLLWNIYMYVRSAMKITMISPRSSTTGVTINGAIFGGGSISAATTLTANDSGKTYGVSQASAYAITLPTAAAGLNYRFVLTTAGANAVTIGTASGANHLFGTLAIDGATTSINAQDTITFVSGTAVVGDWVEIYGSATGVWFVKASASAAGGITVSAS